jgi:hypothetical protein
MALETLAQRASRDPAFTAWFGRSVVRGADGPIVAWRGEHGSHDGSFRTNLGSLSFGTVETACLYAQNPNDNRMTVEAPHVVPCLLRIEKPIMNDPHDPFMDVSLLIAALGRESAMELTLRHSEQITATGNWDERFHADWGNDVAGMLEAHPENLDGLYLLAFAIMDDHDACARLRRAGYDGAICGGYGENSCEPEWRVIDPNDVLPVLCWDMHLPRLALAA